MRAPNTLTKNPNRPLAVSILNRQSPRNRPKLPLRLLRRQAELAVGLLRRRWPSHLLTLTVVLVSPAESASVHAEFLNDSAPTDVITFADGELVICPAVAEQQRHLEGLTLAEEVLTYIIHGCLHLCGDDDQAEQDFQTMRRRQTRLRRQILKTFAVRDVR